jgi:hypothetical protein
MHFYSPEHVILGKRETNISFALVNLSVRNHKAYKRVDVREILKWSSEHYAVKQ